MAGFTIPYRHAGQVRAIGYPAVERRLEAARVTFEALLGRAAGFLPVLRSFAGPPPLPRWDQDWFPRLDGALAYCLARSLRPRRIVEIGSGHSTRFLARGLADGGREASLVCIDPAPRAGLGGLPVRHVAGLLQEAPAGLWAQLTAGDMLFIDSSHVAMPGTDVDLLVNEILPGLPAGLVVHIHDTFLPDPYPQEWAWRGYNEQLLTAALILCGRLEPLFASAYIVSRMAEAFEASGLAALPILAGARESSFWGRLA